MTDFEYSIEKNYGVLSERGGWKKELNLVSWNKREAKFDVRDWAPNYEKVGKGITLTKEEAEKLRDLLNIALSESEVK